MQTQVQPLEKQTVYVREHAPALPLAKISDGAYAPIGGDKAANAAKDKNVATTLDRAAGKALAAKVCKETTAARGRWLGYVTEASKLTHEGRAETIAQLDAYLKERREQATERGRTDEERQMLRKDARVWSVNLSNFRKIVSGMNGNGLDAAVVADNLGGKRVEDLTFADWTKVARQFAASEAAKGKPGRPAKTVSEKLKTYLEKIGGDMATDAAACAKVLRDAATALTAKPKGDKPAAA